MPADHSLESRVRARLADLRADDLLRTMRSPIGVDLSSNDYLKLSLHPRVVAA
jgi:7-keto-8-aminopelargonate synthetase-like enzyme